MTFQNNSERAPDLARTVAEQSETIQTLSRLLSGAEEAAIERAEQIERVREARSMINRIIANAERGVDLGDPVTLAKSIVNKLNDALGDTDD